MNKFGFVVGICAALALVYSSGGSSDRELAGDGPPDRALDGRAGERRDESGAIWRDRRLTRSGADGAATGEVGERADQADYDVARAGDALVAHNPAQSLTASFSRGGVRISDIGDHGGERDAAGAEAEEATMSLRTAGFGCAGEVRGEMAEAEPRSERNRVSYDRRVGGAAITEWYVNRPLGIEQGFDVSARPACAGDGALTVALAIETGLATVIESAGGRGGRGGRVEWRDERGRPRLAMSALHAEDATGRALPARFAAHHGGIALVIDDRDAAYPVAIDPMITTPSGRLSPSLLAAGGQFGAAVALSGHVAVVGAPGAGVAHAFHRDHRVGGAAFVEEIVLSPGSPTPGFGDAVSAWGEVAVVGMPGDASGADPGAVYVFRRIEDNDAVEWIEETVLVASDATAGDRFGAAVSLRGDLLVVGAPGADGGAGAAYAFAHRGGAWHEQAVLTPMTGQADGGFGASVAAWTTRAAVGAPGANGQQAGAGAVFTFTRALGMWHHEAIVTASDGESGDGFGTSVAISGDTLIAGAPDRGVTGAAYTFAVAGGAWTLQAVLAPDESTMRSFGSAVAVAGDTAAVGSGSLGANGQARRMCLFRNTGAAWVLEDEFFGQPGNGNHPDDGFGHTLAVSQTALLVAAPHDGRHGADTGMVHAYAMGRPNAASAQLSCAGSDTLGALATCIRGQMPRSGSGGFVVPTPGERADWQFAVGEMLAGNCAFPLPASLVDTMSLFTFVDTDNGKPYCVMMEITDTDGDGFVDRGWGTFIVDDLASRELSHQSPHPYFEALTAAEAVDVFKATDSRSYLMCGAHRNSNSADSACDSSYNESDCAHSKDNMYYPTTLELNAFYRDATAHTQLQWHGMADSTCAGIDAYVSPGLSSTPAPGSNVLDIQQHSAVHNPTWVVDVPGQGVCSLNATTNTEGRYLNGVDEPDVCFQSASSSTNKFVHIEQIRDVRLPDEWSPVIADTWPVDQPPAAPASLVAIASNGLVELAWSSSVDADTYTLWRATTSGGPYTAIFSASATTHTDLAVTNGTTYHYVVTAHNGFGASPFSAEASAVPMDPPPAPTGLVAVGDAGQVALVWNAAAGADSYTVWRGTASGSLTPIAAGVLTTSYIDTAVIGEVTYFYAVSATSVFGDSPPSVEASATPTEPPPPSCHTDDLGDFDYCSESCPCELGEGDCDDDDECAPGLFCVNNAGADYGFDPDIDVCEDNCHTSSPGSSSYCSSSCPCDIGEGDCDGDSQCLPGLTCVNNAGADYGYSSSTDVCLDTCHDQVPGHSKYCTSSCPCEAGEGDCDNDSQCLPGLECVNNVGANYGYSSSTDVCE